MNLPILASVLLFIIVLRFFINKTNKEMDNTLKSYAEKEQSANFVRKKPLDGLPYITIPEAVLTASSHANGDKCQDAARMLEHLKDRKIVNFNGISNTDLKLKYGTANITPLTEYDQNYIQLVRSLQTLGEALFTEGKTEDAVIVLQFAVDSGSDIKNTYRILGEIYLQKHNTEAFDALITKANTLTGLNAKTILRTLQEQKDSFSS